MLLSMSICASTLVDCDHTVQEKVDIGATG